MEAYKIAIGISLTNNVSGALGLVIRQFGHADKAAKEFQRTLNSIKLMSLAGGAMFGVGYLMARGLTDALKPAREYQHQIAKMNLAGLSQVEISKAIATSWKTTGSVITTTVTDNLRALLDLRNIMISSEREHLGPAAVRKLSPAQLEALRQKDFDAALKFLPTVQMGSALLTASGMDKKQSRDFAYSALKALDITGAVTDPEKLQREFEQMVRVGVLTQGRVTPQMYQQTMWYARQGKFGLTEDFKYNYLPVLLQEAAAGRMSGGGGSRGVGPMLQAANRWAEQGMVNKASIPELVQLRLLPPSALHARQIGMGRHLLGRGFLPGIPGGHLGTTTTNTVTGSMTGINPGGINWYKWATEVVKPAIDRRFGGHATEAQTIDEINKITKGNSLMGSLLQELILKQGVYEREAENQKRAMAGGVSGNYARLLNLDFETGLDAFHAQIYNMKVALGKGLIPVLIPVVMWTAKWANALAEWERIHPERIKYLTYAFVGLAGSLLFSGTVLTLTAAFRALGLLLSVTGVAGSVRALTTALAGGVIATNLGILATALTGFGAAVAAVLAAFGLASGLSSFLPWLFGDSERSAQFQKQYGYTPNLHLPADRRRMEDLQKSGPHSTSPEDDFRNRYGHSPNLRNPEDRHRLFDMRHSGLGGAMVPGGAIQGLNPEFNGRLQAMFKAMPPGLRDHIHVASGFRSFQRQTQLFAHSDGSGHMVARPGHSMHNFGVAADLRGSPAALAWGHAHAGEFGLTFPMPWENWHIEPAGLRSGGVGNWLKSHPGAPPAKSNADHMAIGGAIANAVRDALGNGGGDVHLDGEIVGRVLSDRIERGIGRSTGGGTSRSGARPDFSGGSVLPSPL